MRPTFSVYFVGSCCHLSRPIDATTVVHPPHNNAAGGLVDAKDDPVFPTAGDPEACEFLLERFADTVGVAGDRAVQSLQHGSHNLRGESVQLPLRLGCEGDVIGLVAAIAHLIGRAGTARAPAPR
jgi:hypothetical protein